MTSDIGRDDGTQGFWAYARWILLALAVGLQILQQEWFGAARHGVLNPDKTVQIAMAQSLVDGHGLTVATPSAADIGRPVYAPIAEWPSGYSLLMAVALWCTNDLWRALLVVDVPAIVAFNLAWFVMLEWLVPGIRCGVKATFWLVLACVASPLFLMTSSEVVAMAFFSCGLACCLAGIQRSMAWGWVAAAAALAAAACACRFAFWPLIVVAPAALAAAALVGERPRKMWAACLVSSVVSIGLLALVAISQRWYTGHTTFLSAYQPSGLTGFYWSQLLWPDPFPASALNLPQVWQWVVECVPCAGQVPPRTLFWGVSLALLALILVSLGRRWWAARRMVWRSPAAAPAVAFAVMGVLTFGLTLAMLAYLSLRTPGYAAGAVPGGTWTQVTEDRYYAVFFPFLILALAYPLASLFTRPARARLAPLRIAGILLLVAWLTASGYVRGKNLWEYAMGSSPYRTLRMHFRVDTRVVRNHVREHLRAGRTVLFAQRRDLAEMGPFEQYDRGAARIAGACLAPADAIARTPPSPTTPVVVMALITKPTVSPTCESMRRLVENDHRFQKVCDLYDGPMYEALWPPKPKAATVDRAPRK